MKLKVLKKSILTGCMIIISLNINAQNYDCNCEQTFDKVIEKLEANYIAYHLTKNEIEKSYQVHNNQWKIATVLFSLESNEINPNLSDN